MRNNEHKRRRIEHREAKAEKKRDDRRRDALAVLKTLGLWEGIKRTRLKGKFLDSHYPRVSVALDESIPQNDITRKMEREAQRAASNARFDFPLLGHQYLIGDYFAVVKPLLDLVYRAKPESPSLAAFICEARERINELASEEIGLRAFLTMGSRIEEALIRYGRCNSILYALAFSSGRNEFKKWFISFKIVAASPQKRVLVKEGKPRAAFRCGQPYNSSGVDWVEWRLSVFGTEDDGKMYPVYVQSHALEQLYARMSCFQDGEWLFHEHLWQSLKKPVIVSGGCQSNQWLLEYRARGFKLGYLVVSRCEDVFLIDTFLFLTMDSTPEGEELWKHLRLTRRDKEHLGLDRIETFLATDIQTDPELVSILDRCGCGHLFQVVKNTPVDLARGYADDVRRYLRLAH